MKLLGIAGTGTSTGLRSDVDDELRRCSDILLNDNPLRKDRLLTGTASDCRAAVSAIAVW